MYHIKEDLYIILTYSSSSFSTTASIFHQAFLLLQLLYLPTLAIFQTMILLLPFFVPLFYVFRTILSTLSAKANPLFSFNKWYHIHRQIIYPCSCQLQTKKKLIFCTLKYHFPLYLLLQYIESNIYTCRRKECHIFSALQTL